MELDVTSWLMDRFLGLLFVQLDLLCLELCLAMRVLNVVELVELVGEYWNRLVNVLTGRVWWRLGSGFFSSNADELNILMFFKTLLTKQCQQLPNQLTLQKNNEMRKPILCQHMYHQLGKNPLIRVFCSRLPILLVLTIIIRLFLILLRSSQSFLRDHALLN
jgi:hypothetical protein